MPEIYNYPISFKEIDYLEWGNKEDAFENMCKEFLKQKYEIKENINLINWYPWIECPPVLWANDKYYSFQAKLINNWLSSQLKKSFFWNTNNDFKIYDDDLKKMDILVIFSNKKVTSNLKDTIYWWFKKFNITIEYRVDENFKNELRKKSYTEIRQKYFYNNNVKIQFHEDNKWEEKDIFEINKIKTVNDVNNGFSWNISFDDIELAKEYQEYFLLNKYLYCDSGSFKDFELLESKIPSMKFSSISTYTRWRIIKNMDDVLEYAEKQLNNLDENDLIDLKYFTPATVHKKGLFINYWADWLSEIQIKNDGVKFISKINNNGN